jgi:hypothetical protein
LSGEISRKRELKMAGYCSEDDGDVGAVISSSEEKRQVELRQVR